MAWPYDFMGVPTWGAMPNAAPGQPPLPTELQQGSSPPQGPMQLPPGYQQAALLGTLGGILSNMGNPGVVGRRRGILGTLSSFGPAAQATRQADMANARGDMVNAEMANRLQAGQRQNETLRMLDNMPTPEGVDPKEWQAFYRINPAQALEWLFKQRADERAGKAISGLPQMNITLPGSEGGTSGSAPTATPAPGATPGAPPITYTDQIKGGQPPTAGQQGSVFQPPPQYAGIVGQASQQTGTPPQLLASTAWNESRWNPGARNVGDQRGSINPATGKPYDSVGITQWGEQWAKARGFDPTDPNASIMQTGQAMRQYADKYGGNWMLARLAYGWGPGNVDMWLKSGGDPNKLPEGAKTWLPRSAFGIADDQQARAAFPQVAPMLKPGPVNPWQQTATPQQAQATTGGFPVPPPQIGGLPGAPQRMAALPGSQTAQAGGRPAMPAPQGLPTDNSEVPTNPPPAPGMGAGPTAQPGNGLPPGVSAKPPGISIIEQKIMNAQARYNAALRDSNIPGTQRRAIMAEEEKNIREGMAQYQEKMQAWQIHVDEARRQYQNDQAMTPAKREALAAENAAKVEAARVTGDAAAARAPQVEFDKTLAVADAKLHDEIRTDAVTARNYAQSARFIADMARDNKFAGWGGETGLQFAKALERFGINIPGTGDAQTVQSLASSMGLGNGQMLKGSVSDFEQKLLAKVAPGLSNTPEGIAKLAEIAQRVAQRKEAVADLAEGYDRFHRTDFAKKQRDIIGQPLFTKDEWGEISKLAEGGKSAPAPAAPAAPATTPTIRIEPDGQGGYRQVQ